MLTWNTGSASDEFIFDWSLLTNNKEFWHFAQYQAFSAEVFAHIHTHACTRTSSHCDCTKCSMLAVKRHCSFLWFFYRYSCFVTLWEKLNIPELQCSYLQNGLVMLVLFSFLEKVQLINEKLWNFFSINIKMYGRMNFKIFWEKK